MPQKHPPNRDSALAVLALAMVWVALVVPACLSAAPASGAGLTLAGESFPPGISFIPGAVDGVFIQREGKSLAVHGGPSGRRPAPDIVLLAEARRDVIWVFS